MAIWQLYIPLIVNNRKLQLAQNSTDPDNTDVQLLDQNDNVLATLVLTGTELNDLGQMVGEALKIKELAQ